MCQKFADFGPLRVDYGKSADFGQLGVDYGPKVLGFGAKVCRYLVTEWIMGQKSADIWSLSGLWAKSLQIFGH